ncbi:MAG: hypothetical protein ACFB9M_01565 [Myxococcota bacterium]
MGRAFVLFVALIVWRCGTPADVYCGGLDDCDLLRAGLDRDDCVDRVRARLVFLSEAEVDACEARYESCIDAGCDALSACFDPLPAGLEACPF